MKNNAQVVDVNYIFNEKDIKMLHVYRNMKKCDQEEEFKIYTSVGQKLTLLPVIAVLLKNICCLSL